MTCLKKTTVYVREKLKMGIKIVNMKTCPKDHSFKKLDTKHRHRHESEYRGHPFSFSGFFCSRIGQIVYSND